MRIGPRFGTLLTVVVLAGAAALGGCGGGDAGTSTAEVPAAIRLGALVPLSGTNAQSGREMRDAAQMAVDEVNAAGGVLGRKVELLVLDDACDPGTAVVKANDLVAQDITVSVGGYCSSATVPTLKVFRDAGVPMVIALATSTDLLVPKYDSIFLISGTVTDEGAFAVAAMRRMGSKRLIIVNDGTSFPVTLGRTTAEAAAEPGTGIETVATHELSQGAPSYARLAKQIVGEKVDTVYFTGYYGEANQLIKDLRTAGFDGRIIVGDGATDGPLLTGLTAAQTKNVFGTALTVPALMPSLAAWSKRFAKVTGRQPGAGGPESYDAVTVAVDAIKRAGSTDHAAVRAAIAATPDLPLLSGTAKFNADGTRANPVFLLLEVRDGKLAEVPAG
ncbi:branched-chain amino acid ABC transporter substrate-binding protein [Actinoplanes oblitus]|uniref:Branched-chain amino acid ABC transporter substrate-binding protein n=1 Tax=Actinoplanes oblitus TaxID=3040509 RepID=A0ABY8WP65_9ACTN|nr:branched-chain amino acid ABC transporter substrate-binding protein [Actinoplanes oblitus]WIM98622.1 branched-chain amino acid ABC transporter substrate-binding protein [Actinoplanes oblitus]